jgi:hypothetical protein
MCGVSTGRKIGQFFFKDTMNSEMYVEQMFCSFFECLAEEGCLYIFL